ncbi:MAG: glucose/mannose-6-phosphate isomerase, partial [Glaciecola sp.]
VDEDRAGGGFGQELAVALQGRVGVFLGGRGVGALVAMRAACQVAENAEAKSFCGEIPEFDHNALVGFSTSEPDSDFLLVTIRDPREHPRVDARFAPTLAILRPGVAGVVEHTLPDGPWLSRLAAGILAVDLASVHLALRLERDPTPVDVLVALKTTLAERP